MEPDQEQLVRLQNSGGHRVALHSANLLVLKQGPLCQDGPDALQCNKARVIKRSGVARETVRTARLSKAEKLLSGLIARTRRDQTRPGQTDARWV